MIQQQNPVRGFLVSVGLTPEILIEFQYNPTQLSDRRAITYASLTPPGLVLPDRQYIRGGDRTISFNVDINGLFKGPADDKIGILRDEDGGITPELNKYRAFMYPQTARWKQATASFVPLYPAGPQFTSPPACRFGFGERVIDCVVAQVDITEMLFNARLAPVRAQVAVTLVELSPYEDLNPGPIGGI